MTAEQDLREQSNASEIALPDKLAKIKKADDFAAVKYKWNSNEEVLSLLTSLSNHETWVTRTVPDRPENGSMFLFDRSKVKNYRKDGYTWKKRRSGNTIREDHTRLKVDGIECLSVLYTHSALVPTFHRRCYWMLQNPKIVLVHYLNLVEECNKPITVSVYSSPNSRDDISQQLEAIYSGVSSDVKPEVTVTEESPPGSPSSSEEGENSSSKGKRQRKRNKVVYKISFSPNKSFQAKVRAEKLNIKVIKVTKNNQGRLTVTGHREGSPSLEENLSYEGNDSGTVDDVMCQAAVTPSNGHVFVTSPPSFSQHQPLRDISILSVVPMVTHPSVSTLSYQVQNSLGDKGCGASTVPTTSNCQFLPENHMSNAIPISQFAAETNHNAGIQWNSIILNPRVAELGSSPSSDYGSYMSDAGAQLSFSGSDSMSAGLPAQSLQDSEHALFDGPFRVPLPVERESRQRFTDSAKGDVGESAQDQGPFSGRSQSGENEVSVDMTDLSPLESLAFDMFDCDLSNVIPDCFTDCLSASSPRQSSNGVTASIESQKSCYASSTCTTSQLSSGPYTSASQDQTSSFSQMTTSGPSSTTSYVFVKPVSPARSAVVTSCFVDVNKNTLESSSGTAVSEASTQTSHRGNQVGCEVNMANDSITHTVAQRTVNEVCLIPPPLHGLAQQTTTPTTSDVNNNSSRTLTVGISADNFPTHVGNQVVPISARITDFSPEWSYPEGGAKVLITGEWRMEQGSYTCLFDGCSVPAILYQSGVLRCFCPPHDPGLVTLQVACNGFIVSNACVFEYRARDSPVVGASCHEWLATDDDRFKLAILDRLERLESRLHSNQTSNSANGTQHGKQCTTFEDRLIVACEIFHRPTSSAINAPTKGEKPFRGMTLLHLSAALGFNRLICTLLKLWHVSESQLVREEMNPLRKDEFACTPLTWACALGRTDTAHLLLETEPKALLEPDARGRMPLQLARDRGFLDVVDLVEDYVMSSPFNGSVLGVDSDGTPSPMGSSCEDSPRTPVSAPNSSSLLPIPVDADMVDRANSPMVVDENEEVEPQLNRKRARTLAKTLVHIHSMINEAEHEAELNHRISAHLSPLHENSELITSGSWGAAARLRTFSSASSQSSPLTPCSSKSSLSPGSPVFLNSPHSSPSGPDTTEFQEFISSSRKLLERDFSDLTLTDREQWELYEAAKIIQNAYRNYKTRRHQQEQEIEAAILIQHHYRRYKEFIAFKKMTRAARIIQSQYRTYREHERFKKSRRAAAIIQNSFRSYRERRRSSQRRREERINKRQEARYMQKASKRSKDNMHSQM